MPENLLIELVDHKSILVGLLLNRDFMDQYCDCASALVDNHNALGRVINEKRVGFGLSYGSKRAMAKPGDTGASQRIIKAYGIDMRKLPESNRGSERGSARLFKEGEYRQAWPPHVQDSTDQQNNQL